MAKNKTLIVAILDADTTQIVVAKRARIHETRFSKIVNGHVEPSEDEKSAIAEALDQSIAQLFPASDQAVAS